VAHQAPEQHEPAEPDETVVRRGSNHGLALSIGTPFAVLTAVVLAILVLEGVIPFGKSGSAGPGAVSATGDFFELGVLRDGEIEFGEPAPLFQLQDADGTVIRLDDYRGRPVLVNFWASWCIPCRAEVPDLVALQAEWGDRAQILGVDLQESAGTVTEFAAAFETNYPLPIDRDGSVTDAYELFGLPETFFLDAEGIVRDLRIGQLDPDVARCIVESIEQGDHDPRSCR
jgi:thiol-disulfide isomerase/thioredoxin